MREKKVSGNTPASNAYPLRTPINPLYYRNFDQHTQLLQHICNASHAAFVPREFERYSCEHLENITAERAQHFEVLCCQIIKTDQAITNEDAARADIFAGQPVHDNTGICIGSLFVAKQQPAHFNDFELNALRQVTSLVEKDFSWLQQSGIDLLSGLHTTQGLVHASQPLLAHCKRLGSDATLMFFELRNIATLHELLGGEGAALTIQALGKILQNTLRSSDLAARCGNNSFVALLTHNAEFSIHAVVERLIEEVVRFNRQADISSDLLMPSISYANYDAGTPLLTESIAAAQLHSTPLEIPGFAPCNA